MKVASYSDLIPSFEHERLEALQPYQVLATPGQGVFNDFVGVVAKLFGVPIALVSLVRESDVVFVGNVGLLEVPVTDRENSLCSVAILQDGLTVFEDLATQPCDLVNPLAAQALQLGFYAGQALRTPDGLPIGSLCILDRKARHLSEAEGQLLEKLALVAQGLLRLQAARAADERLLPVLRNRLDGPLRRSFANLVETAELRREAGAGAASFVDAHFEESLHLARTMHQVLQGVMLETESRQLT